MNRLLGFAGLSCALLASFALVLGSSVVAAPYAAATPGWIAGMSDAMVSMAYIGNIYAFRSCVIWITDTDCVPVVAVFILPVIAVGIARWRRICSNRVQIGTKQGDSENQHKQTNCSFHRDSPCTLLGTSSRCSKFASVVCLGTPFYRLQKRT